MDTELALQIRIALSKTPQSRSYDDILLLKSYLSKTELVTKNLASLISPKQLNDICRNMTLEKYKSGDFVFHQGDAGEKVYVIFTGACDVIVKYKIDLTQGESEVREKVLVSYSEGNYFGERALESDEPRSASIMCTEDTELFSITKNSYVNAIKESSLEVDSGPKNSNQMGNKAEVFRILSKNRDARNNQELEAVASHLYRRIPFFQKFDSQQLIELCRVAETVSLWNRSILFKQGQIGQAFYVVLTGSVEVWAQDNNQNFSDLLDVADITHRKQADLTEGLGSLVNQLVTGDVFGERALENESSMRMGSIITCDGLTQLLVISKEDYHNLVYVMMHRDSMDRLALLRKTEMFRSTDIVHLKGLARFMVPKRFQINETIIEAGEKATDIIIIESGECRVQTTIEEYESRKEKSDTTKKKQDVLPPIKETEMRTLTRKSSIIPFANAGDDGSTITSLSSVVHENKKMVNIGRIAPNSVLAAYITQCESVHKDVYHPETIIASTIINAYSIDKHEFFNHLPKDSRKAIVKIVADYRTPILHELWENLPRVMDENQWKKEKAWTKFRAGVAARKKDSDILHNFKQLQNLHLTPNSGNNENTHFVLKSRRRSSANTKQLRDALASSNGELLTSEPKKVNVSSDWGLQSSVPRNKSNSHLSKAEAKLQLEEVDMIATANTHIIRERMTNHDELMKSSSLRSVTMASSSWSPTKGSTKKLKDNLSQEFENFENAKMSLRAVRNLADSLGSEFHNQDPVYTMPQFYKKEMRKPFNLVQIHREVVVKGQLDLQDSVGRNVKCHLRLCGSMTSCATAKDYADILMENIFLTLYKSDGRRESELFLNWTPFKSVESMPLSESDHFLIYCRGIPIEYASISPSLNIFPCPIPATCKQRDQRFAVIAINPIATVAHQHCTQEKEEENTSRIIRFRPETKVSLASSKIVAAAAAAAAAISGSGTVDDNEDDGDKDFSESKKKRRPGVNIDRKKMQRGNSSDVHDINSTLDESCSESSDDDEVDLLRQQGAAHWSKLRLSARSTSPTSKERNDTTERRLEVTSPLASAAAISSHASISSMTTGHNRRNSGFATNIKSLSTAVLQLTGKNNTAESKPQVTKYVLDFSILNEILLTAATRVDALRYALSRFGRVADKEVDSVNPGPDFPNSTSPVLGTKVEIKPLPEHSTHPDRFLELIHKERKKICVVPLFKWLLINDDNFSRYEFVNAFQLMDSGLVQGDDDDFALDETAAHQLYSSLNPSESAKVSFLYADDAGPVDQALLTSRHNPKLVRAFSDAGLLVESTTATTQAFGPIDKRVAQKAQEKKKIAVKQLEILERDAKTKELTKKVVNREKIAAPILPTDTASRPRQDIKALRLSAGGDHTMKGIAEMVQLTQKGLAHMIAKHGDAPTDDLPSVDTDSKGVKQQMATSRNSLDKRVISILEPQLVGALDTGATRNLANTINLMQSLSSGVKVNQHLDMVSTSLPKSRGKTSGTLSLESRLQNLNRVMSEQVKIMQMHDNLCKKEHEIVHKDIQKRKAADIHLAMDKDSSFSNYNNYRRMEVLADQSSSDSKAVSMRLLNQRLELADALQKVNIQKVGKTAKLASSTAKNRSYTIDISGEHEISDHHNYGDTYNNKSLKEESATVRLTDKINMLSQSLNSHI